MFSPPNISQNQTKAVCCVAKQHNKKKTNPRSSGSDFSVVAAGFLAGMEHADPSVGYSSLVVFILCALIPAAEGERGN